MVRQISISCCANYAFFLSGQCLIVLIDPHFDFKSVWRFPRFKSKAWLIHLGVSENMVPLIRTDYHVSYCFHIKITVWGYSKFKHTDFGVHSQKVITGKGIGSRQITVTNQRSTLCLPIPLCHGRSGRIKINWSNKKKCTEATVFYFPLGVL